MNAYDFVEQTLVELFPECESYVHLIPFTIASDWLSSILFSDSNDYLIDSTGY